MKYKIGVGDNFTYILLYYWYTYNELRSNIHISIH